MKRQSRFEAWRDILRGWGDFTATGFSLSILLLTLGCAPDVRVGQVTTTTFDDTIPNGLDSFFAECIDTLLIEGGATEIDISPLCNSSNLPSDPTAFAVYFGLVVADLLTLPPAVEDEEPDELIRSGIFEVEGAEIPLGLILPGGCIGNLTASGAVGSIEATGVRSSWVTTASGEAALHLSFEMPDQMEVVDFELETWAICSDPLGMLFTNLMLDGVLPDGEHHLMFTETSLGLSVVIGHDGRELIGRADVDVMINGIDTTLPWEAEEEILAEISIDIDGDDTLDPLTTDTFESMIEEALLNALNSELGAVVGPLNAQLPQEHVICEVEVVDGELVVTTADRGLTQCRERRLAEAVPKKREAEKDGGRALRKMSFEPRR